MSDAMRAVDLALVTRAGCGLCDEMKRELVRATAALGMSFREIDVDSDPSLLARYGNDVPVILVDGEPRFEHRTRAEAIEALLSSRRARD